MIHELTVVKSLALLFSWFCSFPGISKEAFGRLLYLLNTFLLPTGNTLPNSYQKARATINHLLVPTHEYDCCVNDCIIFRKCAEGDSSHLSSCPKCDEPRYHPCSKVARKKLKYIPLAPWFKRMFANKTVSKLLQSHQEKIATQVVTDLHQSPAWSQGTTMPAHSMVILVESLSVSVLMVQTRSRKKRLHTLCGQ